MRINTGIVLDKYFRVTTNGKKRMNFTMTGQQLFPLETPIPVYKKEEGCIGIGIIKSIYMTAESTSIDFVMSKVSKQEAGAYTNLYQNQLATDDAEDDPYATEAFIPGAAGVKASAMDEESIIDNPTLPRFPYPSHSSLMDEYEDDDDDDYHWD